MKNLIQFAIALFLLVQFTGYSQTKNTETSSKTAPTTTEMDNEKFKGFIGTFLLEEGDLTLEIVAEDNKMYIISPFSKDILTKTNDSTLTEESRGVVLELIKDDKSVLKFTQNGYETTIIRQKAKTEK